MFESFIPKKFCREYVEMKWGSQLALFMAVVLGLKPAMDIWSRKSGLELFWKICRKYELLAQSDLVVCEEHGNFQLKKAIGGQTLTSTLARGLPLGEGAADSLVRVFISHSRENLERAFRSGWYPLVINGRVFNKPYIDHFWFGRALGYPECCIKFFRRYNNWFKYSNLYEIFKNTKNHYHYFCNCLLKDTPYSYIYHMPCSFNCRKTISLAGKIRHSILGREPDYVKKIDEHLKLPLLVFYEKTIYTFEGELNRKNDRLFYRSVYFTGGGQSYDFYGNVLRKGDNLLVKNRDVLVFRGRKPVKIIKYRPLHIPFLVQFR